MLQNALGIHLQSALQTLLNSTFHSFSFHSNSYKEPFVHYFLTHHWMLSTNDAKNHLFLLQWTKHGERLKLCITIKYGGVDCKTGLRRLMHNERACTILLELVTRTGYFIITEHDSSLHRKLHKYVNSDVILLRKLERLKREKGFYSVVLSCNFLYYFLDLTQKKFILVM